MTVTSKLGLLPVMLGWLPPESSTGSTTIQSLDQAICCIEECDGGMTSMGRPIRKDDKSSVKPEILPPDRAGEQFRRGESTIRISLSMGRGPNARSAPSGAFAIIIMVLVIGVLVAATLTLLLGIFLIWVPVLVVLTAGLLLASRIRGYFRGRR